MYKSNTMQDCGNFSQWKEWLEFLLRLAVLLIELAVLLIELWKALSSLKKEKKINPNYVVCQTIK